MIIFIPLGSTDNDFINSGYKNPKALINIHGKPLIFYLLDNLDINNDHKIIIPYNSIYSKHNFEQKLINNYPNFHFIFFQINQITYSPCHTIFLCLSNISWIDEPVLFIDCNCFYQINIIQLWNKNNMVFYFDEQSNSTLYSYIKDDNNIIHSIHEKNIISNKACTGAYGFNSIKIFFDTLQNMIMTSNVLYISNVINQLINQNTFFLSKKITLCDWHYLKTPIQFKIFINNLPKISCIDNSVISKPNRISFNFDNSLFFFKNSDQIDIHNPNPNYEIINLLKYLHKFNNTIIIQTSFSISNNNYNNGKLVFDILEKFNIPFHEIYFGKPCADYFIDSQSINTNENIELLLGYHLKKIVPRDFNQIDDSSINVITKKSNDLSGEIFYYNNIPNDIKDLFPVLFDFCPQNKWYKIEKIIGVTANYLYINQDLTHDNLKHIMNSINRIQSINIPPHTKKNINIYSNYSLKLINRYKNYNYTKFNNHQQIYQSILDSLNHYENNNLGTLKCIHGDPVLTNILLNKHDKIKFIDMRGKVGNTLTIYGDWLYDWSKLYQSLIGYDKILMEKNIDLNYEKNLILFFENYFIKLYSQNDLINLKIITKSLLFTLIPLHDNDKCQLYFNLISNL